MKVKFFIVVTLTFLVGAYNSYAQNRVDRISKNVSITGQVLDEETGDPIPGATVTIGNDFEKTTTNSTGFFSSSLDARKRITIQASGVGYKPSSLVIEIDELNKSITFYLEKKTIPLDEITVEGRNSIESVNLINTVDIQNRPVQNSQDVLKNVPGLFIGQHAGGGKAEQIFLRGFDIDHGTDINLTVDGMPVNMVSHAHGQGYSDLHFIIPETISAVEFNKGLYYSDKGNFNTAGYAEFNTKDALKESSLKLEAGQFNTYRSVAQIKLANNSKTNAYVAGEYQFKEGYFESPQDFTRLNFLGKYSNWLTPKVKLQLSATAFESEWTASGQIPVRAVENGRISRFGAIDDTEGGNTGRYNFNAELLSFIGDDALLKNQAYYSRYDFKLFSNFTFFLDDPVNGDQIRQTENRDIIGYKTEFFKEHSDTSIPFKTKIGAGFRYDNVEDIRLSRTADRTTTLEDLARGDVTEFNANVFVDEEIQLNDKWMFNPSLRLDYFNFRYRDKLQTDPQFREENKFAVSPKFITEYVFTENVKAFVKAGIGFHSNDARVVVQQNGEEILPAAYGIDVGTVFKPTKSLIVSPTLWYLELEQEFVYVGDAGIVEPSGRTQRYGMDLSVRYQLTKWLYSDLDLNYTFANSTDAPEGEDHIPLAPEFSSLAGLSFNFENGINGSLRYKYLGDRPANEDYSLTADGYFVVDAVMNYDYDSFTFGISVENLLNTEWREAQFETESRLQNEQNSVSEIHFTPGTPFFLKTGITYRF